MKTTLIIMAAGIGSRYGAGIKQLAKVGPSGELIIDYSVHDALEAGFDDVTFIIRKDIEADFREVIGNRIEKLCPCTYVFQDVNNLPGGFVNPEGRTKPWGTGHAVLTCKGVVKNPSLVINADDYYGKEVFVKMHDFLINGLEDENSEVLNIAMPGFILNKTLSDNGAVTRGVCTVGEDGYLENIVETKSISRRPDGSVCTLDLYGDYIPVDENSVVSMNMWAFSHKFIDGLEDGFIKFLSTEDNSKSFTREYLLPTLIGSMLKNNMATVKVIPTNARWFGVTYQEDREYVAGEFKKLVDAGVYPESLF